MAASSVTPKESTLDLLELPAEIQISIAKACLATDLKHLCETCRLLCDRLVSLRASNMPILQLTCTQLPELYHTVDLSSHNSEVNVESRGHDEGDVCVSTTFAERC